MKKLMKKFHVADVLTVTTGCMVSPRGIEAVYDILNFMTGDSLFTHQLVRACNVATPVLLARFPQLAKVKKPVFDFSGKLGGDLAMQEQIVSAWVQEQGLDMEFEIEPLAPGEYVSMDPAAEMVQMRGGKTEGIMKVEVEEGGVTSVSEVSGPAKVFS